MHRGIFERKLPSADVDLYTAYVSSCICIVECESGKRSSVISVSNKSYE
jgi:hypothetical protein